MAKAPAFQFYVKDWLSDPALQAASSSSRGIWINALCYMWENVTFALHEGKCNRGILTGKINELAALLRASNGDFSVFLEEAQRLKFADVTICNNEVTLLNRRMYREQKDRENIRLRVAKFRSNIKSNKNVTPPSSSPSPIKKKYIKKSKFQMHDEEWLKELQNKECYSHLSIQEQLQKCITWFDAKGIIVSRQRFLNWINNPKYQSKPLLKPSPKKDEPPPLIKCDYCHKILPVKDFNGHKCIEQTQFLQEQGEKT